jgi:hypothetical protein
MDGIAVKLGVPRGEVISAVLTLPMAFVIASVLSCSDASGSSASIAEMPWGTVAVGNTITRFSSEGEYTALPPNNVFVVGEHKNDGGGSAVDFLQNIFRRRIHGLPPEMIPSTPRSRKTASSPIPRRRRQSQLFLRRAI